MADSLIEQLPKIAAEGKKEAEWVLERLSNGAHTILQTNEYVLPSKEGSTSNGNGKMKFLKHGEWVNRLI